MFNFVAVREVEALEEWAFVRFYVSYTAGVVHVIDVEGAIVCDNKPCFQGQLRVETHVRLHRDVLSELRQPPKQAH